MSATLQMLVIADDLTGANDAGAQFAQAQIRSIVLTDHALRDIPGGYAVAVINTASRHASPREAAERVERAVKLGLNNGARCFYKKTDSTLRGNIAVELKALQQATGAGFLPFVPALPDLGRTTRDGVHYVDA